MKRPKRRQSPDSTMSRRDMLKLGLAGAVVTAGGVALQYSPSTVDSGEDEPSPRSVRDPSHIELPEELKGKEAIQAILKNYNKWMSAGSPSDLKRNPNLAIEKFVSIYNQVRVKVKGKELPELRPEDFDSDDIVSKLDGISGLLGSDDYYLRLMPLFEKAGDLHVKYVAVLSGKVVRREPSTVVRNGETANYTHIVIDRENPNDSMDRYVTKVTNVSALTHRRTDKDEHTVLQVRGNYEDMARTRYESSLKSDGSLKTVAARDALKEYKDLPADEARAIITDRLMKNSIAHEEQHVIDGLISDDKMLEHTPAHLVIYRTITETRGLLSAVATDDAKIGLLNVAMWKEAGGQNGLIGNAVAQLLKTASGNDLRQLLKLSDAEVSRLASRVLQASNGWIKAAREANYELKDQRLIAADQRMKIELLGIRDAR